MTASLRALLSGTIDHAGLFPPASLALEPALLNHAKYVRSPDAWMLGAFVLPLAKFDEAASDLSGFNAENRLDVSALGAKTKTPSEFVAALRSAAATIQDFNSRCNASAGVKQLEMPLAARPGATISEAYDALEGVRVPVFLEAPPDDAERTITALGENRREAVGTPLGFKLRTGGVIASAFPSSIQIARALRAAIEHGVPIKFTAGLHHPVRQFHSSVQTKMHGFLNVLGAGVLAAEHDLGPLQIAAILDEEDPTAFHVSDDAFGWHEWLVQPEKIREHRRLVTSFGSCSFDEPREDLQGLSLF